MANESAAASDVPGPRFSVGQTVVKVTSIAGAAVPVGAVGQVKHCIGPFAGDESRYGYFVEWDRTPGAQTFVPELRLGL